jgi:hypothetical protein
MQSPSTVIDSALGEINKAKIQLKKIQNRQVHSSTDKDYFKSVAYGWFRSHRVPLLTVSPPDALARLDGLFQAVLNATDKKATKTTYLECFDGIRSSLIELRSAVVTISIPTTTTETPPNFSSLASDREMQNILQRRWEECQKCIQANAPLAATVMMGGLLEALFVSRAIKMTDKSPLFKAKATPKDFKTKKPLPLSEWTLRPYIDVGHEIGWITKSGKEIAAVLRDYRNYVHPEKERTDRIIINEHDSAMFWEVTKAITKQLLSTK